jgi:multidrug efflux pump subunit AcrA (membrane-fusion protein)
MTATVNINEKEKSDALLVPLEAVKRDKDGSYVLLSQGMGNKPVERRVELGISDEKNVEIISGISEQDKIVVIIQKYALANAAKAGKNPFMPAPRKKQ